MSERLARRKEAGIGLFSFGGAKARVIPCSFELEPAQRRVLNAAMSLRRHIPELAIEWAQSEPARAWRVVEQLLVPWARLAGRGGVLEATLRTTR